MSNTLSQKIHSKPQFLIRAKIIFYAILVISLIFLKNTNRKFVIAFILAIVYSYELYENTKNATVQT